MSKGRQCLNPLVTRKCTGISRHPLPSGNTLVASKTTMLVDTEERRYIHLNPPFAGFRVHNALDPSDSQWLTTHQRLPDPCEELDTRIDYPTLGALNLRSSPKLPYPDLSTSSFATQHQCFYSLTGFSSASSSHKSSGSSEYGGGNAMPEVAQLPSGTVEEPFRSPLGFHIPSDKMQAAVDAEPDSVTSYWQYSLYRGPRGNTHTVKVHYCKSKETMESVSRLFVDESVIGFDIEWMAQSKVTDGIKKNVSLIQIASEERIALFHIARFPRASAPGDYVAPTFRRIMESPNLSKVGVAIKGDSTRLCNSLDIRCQGLFELSHLYKLIKYYPCDTGQINKCSVSLAQQVKEHLQLPLLKGGVQTSDWSKELDYDQARCKSCRLLVMSERWLTCFRRRQRLVCRTSALLSHGG